MDANATIFSVTNTTNVTTDAPTPILVTLLAESGGSAELTGRLSMRISTTAAEVGVAISAPLQRFGTAWESQCDTMHHNASCSPDGCPAEVTSLPALEPGGLSVDLAWPEADLGQVITIQCPCGNLSNFLADDVSNFNRTASRRCGGDFSAGAVWDDPMDRSCNFSSATRRLCQVADVS